MAQIPSSQTNIVFKYYYFPLLKKKNAKRKPKAIAAIPNRCSLIPQRFISYMIGIENTVVKRHGQCPPVYFSEGKRVLHMPCGTTKELSNFICEVQASLMIS